MRKFAQRYWTTLPCIILLAIFMVGPILWSLYGSLTNMSLTGENAVNHSFVGLTNYGKLFTDGEFPKVLWLTFLFVFFSAIIAQNGLGLLLAMLLQRMPKAACRFVSTTVIAAWVLPETAASFVCYAFFNKDGSFNQLIAGLNLPKVDWLYYLPMLAVILANVWRGTAFSMMNYQAALGDVDQSVSESSALDGASWFQDFFLVKLPMIKQTVVTNLMLITLQTLAGFTLIYVMTAGGPGTNSTTLSVYTYKQAFRFGDIGYGTAISVVMLAVGAIFGIIYIRALNSEKE